MKEYPLISVVIPAHNAAQYIEESINSVLQQDYPNIEIIVIDDGSTDETAKIVQQYDVVYKYIEIRNLPETMNIGFGNANGEYIASIDSDDLWAPNKLSIQMEYFKKDPELDMVFSHMKQFLCPRINIKEYPIQIPEDKITLPGYSSITMLIKKSSFIKVGGFNLSFQYGEFIEWYSRTKKFNLKEVMLDDILAFRRIHKSNKGRNHKAANETYLKVLKAHLLRKRKENI